MLEKLCLIWAGYSQPSIVSVYIINEKIILYHCKFFFRPLAPNEVIPTRHHRVSNAKPDQNPSEPETHSKSSKKKDKKKDKSKKSKKSDKSKKKGKKNEGDILNLDDSTEIALKNEEESNHVNGDVEIPSEKVFILIYLQ